MNGRKIKLFVIFTVTLALLLTAMWLLQALLMPKYMTSIPEGALIAEYYGSAGGHDVIFVGDCEVYENFSPVTLWEEYGITSYIRGGAQQLIWQSYYLLEETLRYEVPKVVVFNVLAMKYGEPQNEAYNRLNLDGMKLSTSKLKSITVSMTEKEDFITYIFPILRYHSRWSELKAEDFKYMFYRDKIGFGGYLMQTGIRPVTEIPAAPPLEDYSFSDTAWNYLDKMRLLCEDYGCELILIKAPSLYPYWYDEWDAQISEYSETHNIKYYNFLKVTDEIGIDWSVDTYDSGLHLNVWGAEKMARYFGEILVRDVGVPDRRGDALQEAKWEKITQEYYKRRGWEENTNEVK